jgi:hypothetical protein
MTLSKPKAYLYLQVIFIVILGLYQLTWYASTTVMGNINEHKVTSYTRTGGKAIVYDVEYYVNDEMYFVRENEVPLSNEIRYNILFPSYAVINTNTNLWTPICVSFLLFFIATTIVFLPIKNNQIIANGSSILLTKTKPYIKIISQN